MVYRLGKDIKLSLFGDDIIIYVENILKINKRNILELIINHNKCVGNKINIQKPMTFLYTINVQVKFEFKNTMLFTSATR